MTQRRSATITVTAVEAMGSDEVIHDTKVKGFMVRRRDGAPSYAIKMRVNGRQRFFTIGRHGQPWTPETARKQAIKILADPSVGERIKDSAPLPFKEAAERFLAVEGPKLRPSSLGDYTQLVRDYLIPAFGKMPVDGVSYSDVNAAHARWKAKPRAANFALAVMSRIMTWAEDEKLRPRNSNPCRRITRYETQPREVFLQADQLARLGQSLDNVERENLIGPVVVAAFRLLLLTGARLSEILTLKWDHVDLERRMLFLPTSKTGKKAIALNDAAMDVLSKLPRLKHNPYVLIGKKNGGHLTAIQKPWRIIRARAKLDHVRIHDLRHTYASFAVAAGGSLPIIGRQLGHSQPSTTQKYSHLTDTPVQQLAQTTGTLLADALRKKPQEPTPHIAPKVDEPLYEP